MNPVNRIIFSGNQLNSETLNGIDIALRSTVVFAWLYDHVLDENVLIGSLKNCLRLNPYFSGRLKNLNTSEPVLTACDSGVLFSVENYSENIECFFAADSRYLDRSYIEHDKRFSDEYTPVLQIKISQYYNGSILGITFNHRVCDARSMIYFLNDWAAITRGEQPENWLFSRELIKEKAVGSGTSPSKIIPVVKDLDELPEQALELCAKKTFRIKSNFVEKLIKTTYENEVKIHPGVRHAILPAYIWKLITSKQAPKNNKIGFSQVYDARSLLGLSNRYFGNALTFSFVHLEDELISKMSLKSIADKILRLRDDLSDNVNEIFLDIAYWNAKIFKQEASHYQYEFFRKNKEGTLFFNNYSKLPIFDADFGNGPPIWFELPRRGVFGPRYAQTFYSPEKNGDIILLATLPEAELSELSRHFDAISADGF